MKWPRHTHTRTRTHTHTQHYCKRSITIAKTRAGVVIWSDLLLLHCGWLSVPTSIKPQLAFKLDRCSALQCCIVCHALAGSSCSFGFAYPPSNHWPPSKQSVRHTCSGIVHGSIIQTHRARPEIYGTLSSIRSRTTAATYSYNFIEYVPHRFTPTEHRSAQNDFALVSLLHCCLVAHNLALICRKAECFITPQRVELVASYGINASLLMRWGSDAGWESWKKKTL